MKMSELMKSDEASLPERIVKICVSGKLLAKLEEADRVLVNLEAEIQRLENMASDSDGEYRPKRRMVEKPKLVQLREQAAEQAAVVDVIRDKMLEHEIPVLVRAKEPGEWQQFIDANPAREKDDDKAAYTRDLQHASLTCNIDALRAVAGDYVVKYGDEDATPDMWEWLTKNAARGDQIKLAKTIVSLHEGSVDPGKSRRDWLATRRDEVA